MAAIRPRIYKILSVLSWIASLVIGLLDIYVAQFIAISIYARFFLGTNTQATSSLVAASNTLRIATTLIVGVLYLVLLVVTTEFHFKHLDEPASWRLLGRTIAVEVLIIIVAYFMGPVTW